MFNKSAPPILKTPSTSNSLPERPSRPGSLNSASNGNTGPQTEMGENHYPESATSSASLSPITPTAHVAETRTTNQLIVGPEVKLRGAEILDCDTLVVEGRVEATMDSRVIRIAEHGSFSGKVSIDIAEIHGQFEGELTVRQQLIVHATGSVKGTVRYGKLLVEAGGTLSGNVESLADVQSSRSLNSSSIIKPLLNSAAG